MSVLKLARNAQELRVGLRWVCFTVSWQRQRTQRQRQRDATSQTYLVTCVRSNTPIANRWQRRVLPSIAAPVLHLPRCVPSVAVRSSPWTIAGLSMFVLDLAGTSQSVFFLRPLSLTATLGVCMFDLRSKQRLYRCNSYACNACTTPPTTLSLTSGRNSPKKYSGVSRRLGGSTWFCRTWPTAAVKGGHVLAADWRGAKRYSVPKKKSFNCRRSHSTTGPNKKDKMFQVGLSFFRWNAGSTSLCEQHFHV